MKTLIQSIVILCVMLISSSCSLMSQSAEKHQTIAIQTSAECGMCKKAIEKAMAYERGVKTSDLEVESAVLTVTYDPKKTNPDKIRKAVAKTGYDADDVPADKKAHDNLPNCCQKGGMEKMGK
jgi:periplasmic mercuric ion binding protein